jgi:hypothetical protein
MTNASSNMTKIFAHFLIYGKPFIIDDFATALVNFLINEENLIFFFISAGHPSLFSLAFSDQCSYSDLADYAGFAPGEEGPGGVDAALVVEGVRFQDGVQGQVRRQEGGGRRYRRPAGIATEQQQGNHLSKLLPNKRNFREDRLRLSDLYISFSISHPVLIRSQFNFSLPASRDMGG